MRRGLGILLFLALYGAVIGLTHFFLALRLVMLPGIASPLRELLLASIAALGFVLFFRPLAERFLDPRVAALLAWPAFVWMGLGFLLLISFWSSDLALWILDHGKRLAGGSSERLLSDPAQAALVAAGALALGGTGLWIALRPPALRRVEVPIRNWPRALEGFRIVQLSDVHIGPLLGRRFAAAIVERVRALAPDLVVVTGDLVDGSVEELAEDVEPLRGLHARYGVYFVTGNHDYFSRADPWLAKVEELGFRPLRNQRVTIGEDGGSFDLAGVDDRFGRLFGNGHGEDLPRAVAGRDPGRPMVLLAHNPATFPKAAEAGVDLQLSGHTHGGQIWPFGYVVRMVTPFVAGAYRRNGSMLYVSRGTGFWGPPMRLFARAEITELVIRGASS